MTTPSIRPHPNWLPSLLGLFIAVGPAATDMYLPSFPAVESAFGTAPGTAQLTLATWFAGLALGQLNQGSLADRFGRRLPLMAGFGVFTLATIGCALAPTLPALAVFRLIAAFGASAGMVIARAVVRDLAEGQAAAIMMSRLVLVMGLAPILAPSIGGGVLVFAQWRVIFWLLAAYGVACILSACSLVACAQLNARLLPIAGLSRMLTVIAWVSFTATLVLTALAFSGVHILWAIIAPLVVIIGCQGFANANTNAGALSRHAGHAGSAAALMGTFQFGLGASAGLLVSLLTDGTPRGMAAMMACGMLGAVIADRVRPRTEWIRR
ncbi:hypothetical protein CCS01_19470 [Rhodopila globiformis]|uniref:Major facilitator superfamily (MFS) profile domain-containing protein n=2 Tax=Rhodopila globiformis TaxID=1071 RepID=A0A2S6N6V0_RHOGL|nr:MFS transporter [Rhodopila globiformis]PPQ30338.1 hypothetical protein CCS01_19470 [Rhodopila globiformis]